MFYFMFCITNMASVDLTDAVCLPSASSVMTCKSTRTTENIKYSTRTDQATNCFLTKIWNHKQLYLQVLLYITNHVIHKILIIFLEKIITSFASCDLNNF